MAVIVLVGLVLAALAVLDPPRPRPAARDDGPIRRLMRLEP